MFQIDFKSRKPIYDQVVENFKRLITTGVLRPEEGLPDYSQMAGALTINPNIVQRAYQELELQGYFYYEDDYGWAVAKLSGDMGATRKKRVEDLSSLYGRIHADMQELIQKADGVSDFDQLIGKRTRYYLEVEDLTKYFNDSAALHDLSLSIRKGTIYGLVGVNGSGKTTLIKHIAGIYQEDSGFIGIEGIPLHMLGDRVSIAYVPDDIYFTPQYTLKRLASFLQSKHKHNWDNKRYQTLVRNLELNDEQKLSSYSPGMRKQAGFILSISATPDLMLLDETLDGLDPIVRKKVLREIIIDVAERQMTVLVSSHNVKELDGICDTIGIINRGFIGMECDVEELKAGIHKINVAFRQDFLRRRDPYEGLDILFIEELGNTHLLVVRGRESDISAHLRRFHPLVYDHLPMTLEEIFMYEGSGDYI